MQRKENQYLRSLVDKGMKAFKGLHPSWEGFQIGMATVPSAVGLVGSCRGGLGKVTPESHLGQMEAVLLDLYKFSEGLMPDKVEAPYSVEEGREARAAIGTHGGEAPPKRIANIYRSPEAEALLERHNSRSKIPERNWPGDDICRTRRGPGGSLIKICTQCGKDHFPPGSKHPECGNCREEKRIAALIDSDPLLKHIDDRNREWKKSLGEVVEDKLVCSICKGPLTDCISTERPLKCGSCATSIVEGEAVAPMLRSKVRYCAECECPVLAGDGGDFCSFACKMRAQGKQPRCPEPEPCPDPEPCCLECGCRLGHLRNPRTFCSQVCENRAKGNCADE